MTTCAFVALLLGPRLVTATDPPSSAPTAPAPRMDDGAGLSLTGTVVWTGLQNQRVSLTLANGNTLAGKVVAQDRGSIAIARSADGSVVAVPKAEVVGVKMFDPRWQASSVGDLPSPAARPRESGRRAHVAGAVLLSLGVPIGVSGTAMLFVCASCFYIHLPLLLPGIGMIIGGSRLLKKGYANDRAFRKAWGIPLARNMQLTPNLALGRGGGQLGFSLRF
jgi:hypothetical protein